MADYNIQDAQKEYADEIIKLKNNKIDVSENQEAIIFAKILVKQTAWSRDDVTFCSDNELYVSKTPTGYDVVGYYINNQRSKTPFNVTVCKVNGVWFPSGRYVAADTKSCSGSILLWILLCIGCTLMGILMYFLMSAAIGI